MDSKKPPVGTWTQELTQSMSPHYSAIPYYSAICFFCQEGPKATASHALRTESEEECAPANSHAGQPSQRGPQGVTPGTRPGLWPPATGSVGCTLYTTPPEDFSSCTLGPRRRPKAMRDNPRPSSETPCTPIGSWGPFQAGGQAPPFHQVTKSRQGEFYAIPRHLNPKL